MPPAPYTALEKHLDEQKKHFSDTFQLGLSADMASKVRKAYSEDMPKGEHASDKEFTQSGLYADEQFELEIAKTQGNTGMNYSDAVDVVTRTHPQLLKAYCDYTNAVSEGRV